MIDRIWKKAISLYFDAAFEAMELWGKWHAAHEQGSSHVGETYHQFFGLSLYLNGQFPGGGQDQSQGAALSVCWFLEEKAQVQHLNVHISHKYLHNTVT